MSDLGGPVADRLADLGERYGLTPAALQRLAAVLAGLTEDPRAPTTVRETGEALDVHIADSLVALELEQVRSAERVADIGAGAGLPGLVLAAALEQAGFWLVESQAAKCAFIAALGARAGVRNARVVHARAEEWTAGLGLQDLVICRALAAQPVVLEYAAPLLEQGGHLLDWRGVRLPEEEARAALAGAALGLRLVEVRRVEPFAAARDRHLHLFEKIAPTPPEFPRRAGLARKRPLGS
jgi:16S rRNA (guanine527-N7)-methyltransferase